MGIGNDLIGDVERLMADRVLRRRALHRMIGPASQCWRAEAEIEAMYPGTRCLLLPSATVGLALVLELLDLEPGREVLIPAFGWLSNWSCIRRAGLVPRFLPLDDDLQLRADAVAERLTPRTGAVIVTHLMGRGHQEIAAIAALCAERGVPLLEDIAQSFGVAVERSARRHLRARRLVLAQPPQARLAPATAASSCRPTQAFFARAERPPRSGLRDPRRQAPPRAHGRAWPLSARERVDGGRAAGAAGALRPHPGQGAARYTRRCRRRCARDSTSG